MVMSDVSAIKRPRWWYGASLALALAGLVFLYLGAALHGGLNNGLQGLFAGVGGLLVGLFALTIFVLRRMGVHSYRMRHLLDFGNVAGLMALGFGGSSLINGACDPHPLEEHEVLVLRAPEPGVRGRPGAVEDWRAERANAELQIQGIPEDATPGDRVIVVIGPGLLGPWIAEVRPAAPPGSGPSSG